MILIGIETEAHALNIGKNYTFAFVSKAGVKALVKDVKPGTTFSLEAQSVRFEQMNNAETGEAMYYTDNQTPVLKAVFS